MNKSILVVSTLALATLPLRAQEPRGEHKLGEVLVYSTRTPLPLQRVPGKVELISPTVIERSGLTDLTDVLKTQSSVDLIQYPGYLSYVGLRGLVPSSDSRYVGVLINGVPAGTANLSTIGLSGIEQIEVLKGPFSSVYGTNAMGGVINVITHKSRGPLHGSVGASAGSYSSGGGSLSIGGSLSRRLSFDFGASYRAAGQSYRLGRHSFLKHSEIEKLILDPSTKGERMPMSNNAALTGNFRVGYEFSPSWSLNVYENVFLGNGLLSGGTIWGVYDGSKKDLNRSLTSLELEGRLGLHRLLFTPYYSIEKSEAYDGASDKAKINYVGDTRAWGATLQDEIRLGRHMLVVGVDSKNTDSKSRRYDQDGNSIVLYNPDYSTRNLGLFAQANLHLLDALTLSAGMRADFTQLRITENSELKSSAKHENFNILSPNLGLKYELLPGLMAHATIGSSFTAPTALQKAGRYQTAYGITEGNPDLKPERSLTYDVGIGYSDRRKGLQLDLTYFNTHHRDMIVATSAGKQGTLNVTTYANANKARMSGLELVAAYDFGSLADYRYSLRASVNAALMMERKVNESGNWRQMDGVRKQNVNLGLDYGYKRFELGLHARFIGERQERNLFSYYESRGVRTGLNALAKAEYPDLAAMGRIVIPKAMIFDASAHYSLTPQLRLGVNLNNFLDEHYAERDGYHMPGRNVLFTANYRF